MQGERGHLQSSYADGTRIASKSTAQANMLCFCIYISLMHFYLHNYLSKTFSKTKVHYCLWFL